MDTLTIALPLRVDEQSDESHGARFSCESVRGACGQTFGKARPDRDAEAISGDLESVIGGFTSAGRIGDCSCVARAVRIERRTASDDT